MANDKGNDLAGQWPEPGQFKKSIRVEFSLYVSGFILVLMLVTGYVITTQYVETVTRNVVEMLLVQAESFSGPAGKVILVTADPDALLLNNICNKLAVDNPDIYWAGIADQDNQYIAHTDIKQVMLSNKMNDFKKIVSKFDPSEDGRLAFRSDTIYITAPIKENGILIGNLRVAASDRQIREARQFVITSVASITLLMILIGIPITMFVINRKLRPLGVITNSLKFVNFEDISFDIPVNSKNEFGFLAETLRVMGSRLNQSQREMVERERISRELEIAREIQSKMLPRGYLKTNLFEFAGIYVSAREIGGDYYDFIEFGDGYTGFLVADVSGKSLPGMLVMLLTRDIVKRQSRFTRNPAKLLSEVNRELLHNIKQGMFVTMFLGVIDENVGRVEFASAGHNPLIRFDSASGEIELIKTKGFPLGMVPAESFDKRLELGSRPLRDGDWLIQYTDGINEARNAGHNEFGMDRFTKQISSCTDLSPANLVNRIVSLHNDFVGDEPQFDDITLLVMKWGCENVDNRDSLRAATYESA